MRSLYIIVLLALAAAGCGERQSPESRETRTTVRLVPVREQSRPSPVRTSGVLYPSQTSRLSFMAGGIIERITVNEGQEVRSGDLLAQLKMDQIDAQWNQAKSGLEKARRDHQRTAALYADSVATLEQMQNSSTALRIAEANEQIARFNREHATIHAPSDGIVLARFSEADELVAAGQPILYFGRPEKNWVLRVGVAARDLIRLSLDDSASIHFEEVYPGWKFEGRVSEIAQAMDPALGNYPVEIALESGKTKMVTGFIGRASIYPAAAAGPENIIVPVAALTAADGRRGYVFTLNPDSSSVRRVEVEIEEIIEEGVVIASSSEPFTSVVADGAAYLSDGALVRIVP